MKPRTPTRRSLKTSLTRLATGYGLTTLLLIWTGPFNTFDLFPTGTRIVYWGFINFLGWILTTGSAIGVDYLLTRHAAPLSKRLEIMGACLAGCLSALPLALVVSLTNQMIRPYSNNPDLMDHFPSYLTLLSYIAPLTILISVLYALWHHNQAVNQASQEEAKQAIQENEQAFDIPKQHVSAFFDRLPKHLGTELLWLSSQDHYLEVKTRLGKDLILMRLGDAIKELDAYPGARIHRSHWVADKAVVNIENREGRLFVHLEDETSLPISRTYRKIPTDRGWPTSRKTAS